MTDYLTNICELILTILIPPLGVLVTGIEKSIIKDVISVDVIINILFTFLGYIPGI